MEIRTLYHGSDKEVKKPEYGIGKADNDYGSGFYTTEDVERAKEWAVINGNSSNAVCNSYQIDFDGLRVLRLDDYGTLAWISEVISNRGTENEMNSEIGMMLAEKYRIDTTDADIIIGYRADDSYIRVVDAFLENRLTIEELDRMFRKGRLGQQVFIKSKKAFDSLVFKGSEKVGPSEEYGASDKKARKEVSDFLNKRDREIQIEGLDVSSLGLIAREVLKNDYVYNNGYYVQKEAD